MSVVSDFAHSLYYVKTFTSSTKPEVHEILAIALPSEKDRATATDNMCRKIGEICTFDFWDMRADKQLDTLIAILRTLH